jgi:IS5 family transposase
MALPVVDKVNVPRRGKRPRKRPKQLEADRGYDSKELREELRKRRIRPVIIARKYNNRKHPRKGRPPGSYKPLEEPGRWKIERSFAWLQNYRKVTIRWDYYTKHYIGWVTVACIAHLMTKL